MLKRSVSMTIAAWDSCFKRPLVGISGGLDSSIVATCLASRRSDLACVTLITDDPLGDERRYSRELCSALGARLVDLPYRCDDIDLDVSVSADVPLPCGKLHEQAYNAAIRQAAEELGADVFLVGAGGDNVFYATHSARPLVDRYDAEGLSRGLAETLGNIAAITGASAWTVAREAFRLARDREVGMHWLTISDFLDPGFVETELAKPIDHPWFHSDRGYPLGKLSHVRLLLRAMNHVEHRDKALSVPALSPLLSQPIMETTLAIPSWEFVEGGVDRSVARRAFASMLPQMITGRAGKGSPEGFVAQFIENNRAEITSRLLEGNLARQGLIDRPALERSLRANGRFGDSYCPRIMSLLDIEAWARHWSSRLTSV